jgi:hypothetical protein
MLMMQICREITINIIKENKDAVINTSKEDGLKVNTNEAKYIVTYLVSRQGFGLVIGVTGILQTITIIRYGALVNLHT